MSIVENPNDPSFDIEVGPVGSPFEIDFTNMAAFEADEDAADPRDSEFYDNLADQIPEDRLASIAAELSEAVDRDIQSRSEWDHVLARGMNELGFDRTNDARSDPFPGASAVTHPMLAQACVDFQARAIKELFPANGPVRTRVVGAQTPQKLEKAERVREYMNWQLTEEITEYRNELDTMLMMLPLTGSTFKKLYWDASVQRPRSEYVLTEDFVVPYSASDLRSAPRFCHILRMYEGDIARNVASGLWREVNLGTPSETDESEIKAKSDRIEGKERDGTDDDRYEILEIYADLSIPEADESPYPLPYIVTVLRHSNTVLGVRRNWREDDDTHQKRIRFCHYKFIPWRGFYGVGLYHLIGGLSKGATGSLRALMDSAMIQNVPGGVRLRGARITGGEVQFRPMEFAEIDAPGIDDIRKVAMPYPTQGPSSVLFQLLGFLTEAGARFAGVATQAIAEQRADAPVGTTLALIEQGSMVYSAIHARLHFAQAEELRALHGLNYDHLDDEKTLETFAGELLVTRDDFDSEVDVVPVSDPNVFSQVQRAGRSQAALQLIGQADQAGVPVNKRAAFIQVAESMDIPNIDVLFPEPQQAMPLDPVSEIAAIKNGMPVAAFPGQNHGAHITFLMGVAQNPMTQPLVQLIGPQLQALISDHIIMGIRAQIEMMLGQPLPPPGQPLPPQVAAIISEAAAAFAQQAQSQQAQQAGAAGAPIDPAAMIMAQAEMAKVQQRADEAKMDYQTDQQKLAFEREKLQYEAMRDAAEMLLEKQKTELGITQDEADRLQKYQVEMAKLSVKIGEVASRNR